eukprot:9473036-Pyramimonas_sp.AAC.1
MGLCCPPARSVGGALPINLAVSRFHRTLYIISLIRCCQVALWTIPSERSGMLTMDHSGRDAQTARRFIISPPLIRYSYPHTALTSLRSALLRETRTSRTLHAASPTPLRY